ncbi:hypothetical protein H2684_08660 [Clostridium sp. cel8]|jgi:hypothetical protein|uniref:DUF5685 family protein n=1 Tax=Clostridium sp. cel8 TaxID=2663123 RepID=UPI0015F37AEE|nr:DUF5685 family protein [Clostridium sp. cel8]MBA5851376.1 hypothetical protein [Clostridium sp. cel8]
MFGYITPCIPELKVKDYEKFKAYYCGLCRSIRDNIGNLPRTALNYDMTFLAIFLDSLSCESPVYKKQICFVHPSKKRTILQDNAALKYAAFCNIGLTYYKLLDNIEDDNSKKDLLLSSVFKIYLNKFPKEFKHNMKHIKDSLYKLSQVENNNEIKSFDKICDHFSQLTAFILSNYTSEYNENLYWFGYNLGKWIYIIDALDDLKNDMKKNKFNVLNRCFNDKKLCFHEFYPKIKDRVDFILGTCASQCMDIFNKLPIKKNKELLYNILQYGLLEKMDTVFKRGVYKNEKSL